jgi:hypothetical protein
VAKKDTSNDPAQALRDERDRAEQAGDTQRVAEIDRQVEEQNAQQNPQGGQDSNR